MSAPLRYGSVCSGIEAATVAWHPLGWRPQFFSEIEAAPRAVLSHHYPSVPLHGDFTTIREGEYGPIDLLVGGTPCQSFSVAGLRGGLDDERGNLALGYLQLARRLRPRWLVWENVPGVLSSNGGRDFGAILGGMVELGYGFAYRVLDAQFIRTHGFERAVPQRRRRVFVVGHLGDWRRPAAVLFERACLSGHPAPRREAGKGTAVGALAGTGPGGGWRVGADEAAAGQLVACDAANTLTVGADQTMGFAGDIVAHALRGQHNLTHREDADTLVAVAHSLRGEGFDASEDGTGRGTPLVPVAYGGNDTRGPIEVATAVNAHGGPHGRLDFESETFIAFDARQSDVCIYGDKSAPLDTDGFSQAIAFSCKDHGADATDAGATPTLRAMGFDRSHANAGGQLAVAIQAEAVAFQVRFRGDDGRGYERAPPASVEVSGTLETVKPWHVAAGWAVRRLTPLECERLQGFPDGYTLIPTNRSVRAQIEDDFVEYLAAQYRQQGWGQPAPSDLARLLADGPRYKMLGNSMAVNCMRWIGWRIEMVEAVLAQREAA